METKEIEMIKLNPKKAIIIMAIPLIISVFVELFNDVVDGIEEMLAFVEQTLTVGNSEDIEAKKELNYSRFFHTKRVLAWTKRLYEEAENKSVLRKEDLVYPDDMATVYTWNGSVVNPGIGSLDMMDEDYAYIDADRKVDFTIKGIAPTPVDDPVHMTLFVEGFSDYLLSFDVIVAPIRVTGIENVSLPTIMYVGQRYSSNDLPSMINVLPENATNKYVNWASSNEEVLMANGREIRAFKPGESTITVASVDNEEINVRSLVTVYNSISSVAFNKVEVTVEKGGTIDLKKYVTTSPIDNLYDVQYSFSIVNEWDEEYISISDDGILTGLKTNGYGWAQVAVSAEDGFGNTASSETYLGVIVHAGVTSLVLPEKDEIMWVDDIKELHDLVTVLPEDANYQGLDYTITNVDVESDEVIIQDAYDEIGYGHTAR